MAVYKRENSKYYWTRFEMYGKEYRYSTKCTSKQKARDYEDALKTQLKLGRIGIDTKPEPEIKFPTFKQAVEDYLGRADTGKESTHRRYVSASKAPLSFLGAATVETIKQEDIERYIAWRKGQHKKAPARLVKNNPRAKTKKPLRPATINRELALIRIVFNNLIKLDVIAKNPVRGVKFLSKDNYSDRVVSAQEFRTYIMATSQPLRDIAVLIYETGMRPSEVTNLQKSHVDFATGKIKVIDGKTKSARRRLTMTPAVRDVLWNRYASTPNEYLFAGGKDGQAERPVIKVTNAHNAAVKRSGVPFFRLYDLRHTFATEWVESGGDLVTLAAYLGHSNLKMIMRYAHPTEKHQLGAVDRLMDYRSGSKKVIPLRAVS